MAPPLSPLEMSVQSADGILLKGILEYPDETPGTGFPLAVLSHQYPATADSFGPLVEDLLDLGVACLAFDQRFARMVGELRDRKISGSREEISAALDALRQDDTLRPEEWFRLEKQLGLG